MRYNEFMTFLELIKNALKKFVGAHEMYVNNTNKSNKKHHEDVIVC